MGTGWTFAPSPGTDVDSLGSNTRVVIGGKLLCHEAARMPRDHEFFVGLDDPDLDPARFTRDYPIVALVPFPIELEAEKTEPGADALPDRGRALADTGREGQDVEPAQRGRIGGDVLGGLIAEKLDGFGGARIGGLALQQVAHIRARLRHSQQA